MLEISLFKTYKPEASAKNTSQDTSCATCARWGRDVTYIDLHLGNFQGPNGHVFWLVVSNMTGLFSISYVGCHPSH